MKRWHRIGFLALVGALPLMCPAEEAARALAGELIGIMKVDEQAVQRVERSILGQCRKDECDEDMRSCLMRIDRDVFTLRLVDVAQRELRPAELQEAIDYFRTETGLRHLDILRAEQGLGGDASLFTETPDTRARMLAFLDTRAGYLLITRALLTDGILVNGLVGQQVRLAFHRCKPGA